MLAVQSQHTSSAFLHFQVWSSPPLHTCLTANYSTLAEGHEHVMIGDRFISFQVSFVNKDLLLFSP